MSLPSRRGLLAGSLGAAALGVLTGCGGQQDSGASPSAKPSAALQPSTESWRAALAQSTYHDGTPVQNLAGLLVGSKGVYAWDAQSRSARSAGAEEWVFTKAAPSVVGDCLQDVPRDTVPLDQVLAASGTSGNWNATWLHLKSGRTIISGSAATVIDGKPVKAFDSMMSLEALAVLWDEALLLSGGRLSGFRLHPDDCSVKLDEKSTYVRLARPGKQNGGLFDVFSDILAQTFTLFVPPGTVQKYSGQEVAAAVQRAMERHQRKISQIGSIQLAMTRNAKVNEPSQPAIQFGPTDEFSADTRAVFLDPGAAKKVEDYVKNR